MNSGNERTPKTLNGQRDMLPKARDRADNTFVPRGARRDSPGQPAGAIAGGDPDPAEVRATRPDPDAADPEQIAEPLAATRLHAAGPIRAGQRDKPRDEREAEELAKRKSDHGSPPAPAYDKAEKKGEKEKERGEGTGKHRRDRTPDEAEIDEAGEESFPASDPPSWSPGHT